MKLSKEKIQKAIGATNRNEIVNSLPIYEMGLAIIDYDKERQVIEYMWAIMPEGSTYAIESGSRVDSPDELVELIISKIKKYRKLFLTKDRYYDYDDNMRVKYRFKAWLDEDELHKVMESKMVAKYDNYVKPIIMNLLT